MTIEKAQEIVKKEGLAWTVINVKDVSDFDVLISCKWVIDGVEETRYVFYSNIYDGVCKIQ